MADLTIQEGFDALDEILSELGKPELSLESSMELYKKGISILKQCNDTLDKTEKELKILQEVDET